MSYRKRVESARSALDKARDSVYTAAYPRRDVRFSDCLAMASDKVREKYQAAYLRLADREREAINAGKAWRGQFDMLFWY